MKVCLELFFVFFRIGLVMFGGGYAMLPHLEHSLVAKRGWTTSEKIHDYYVIGQATPGIIAVNVATFIGYNKKGLLGAIFATAGIVAPSIIIITLIAAFLSNFAEIVWVQKALLGVNVAVAALLTKAVHQFSKSALKDIVCVLLLVVALVALVVFSVPAGVIIVSTAVLGILIQSLKAGKNT